MRKVLLTAGLLLSGCVAVAAWGAAGSGGAGPAGVAGAPGVEAEPVLLELFTSEGCSSCPPADALLKQLSGTRTSAGQMLVVLSEHVTYWNRLGWADPFSAETYTARQNSYGDRFHLDSVYTPQLVVNGNEQVVGSERGEVEAAIRAQRHAPHVDLRLLSAHGGGGQVTFRYAVGAALPPGGADLYAALADDMDESHVLRGENEGRTLAHVSVARAFVKVGHIGPGAEAGAGTELAFALPPDAGPAHGPQHLVLFVQQPGLGPVLGVAALALPSR